MRNIPNIFVALVSLSLGVMVIINSDEPRRWYTGVTFLLIGGVGLRRVLKSIKDNRISYAEFSQNRAFRENPLEASLIYLVAYFGILFLINDVRVLLGSVESESWVSYVLSFSILVITIIDQWFKRRNSEKSDA